MILSVYLLILAFNQNSRALFAPQPIINHQIGHESSGQFKLKPFPVGKHVYTIVPQVNLSTVLRPMNVGCYKDLKLYYLVTINESMTPVFVGDVNIMIDKGVRAFRSPINESFELTYTSDESMDCENEFIFGRHVPENFTCPRSFYEASKKPQHIFQFGALPRAIDVCVFRVNSSSMVELQMGRTFNEEAAVFIYETNSYAAGSRKEINRFHVTTFLKTQFITSSTNSLTVVMYRVKKYSLSFRQTEKKCQCPQNEVKLGSSPYYEISAGYPDEYCFHLRCNTTFNAAPRIENNLRTAIRFKLNDFDISSMDWIQYWPGGFIVRMEDFQNLKLNSIIVFNESAHLLARSWRHQAGKGYNITVEAIAVHIDCACPELEGNRLRFEIKSWCEYVDCIWDFGHGNHTDFGIIRRLKIIDNSIVHHETEFLGIIWQPYIFNYKIPIPTLGRSDRRLVYLSGLNYRSEIWFHRQKNSDGKNGYSSLLDIVVDIKDDCDCPETELKASLEWATYNLPGSPDSYCRNVACWRNITSPEGTLIEVRLELPPPPYLAMFNVFDEPELSFKVQKRHMISLWRQNITISQNISSSNVICIFFVGLDTEYAEPFYLRYRYVEKESPILLYVFLFLLVGLLVTFVAFIWKKKW